MCGNTGKPLKLKDMSAGLDTIGGQSIKKKRLRTNRTDPLPLLETK